MAEMDTSFYPKPQGQYSLPDLLKLGGTFAQGEIMQRNIDPATGLLNTGQAMKDIANNPAMRVMAPEAYGRMLELQAAQMKIREAQQSYYTDKFGALADKPEMLDQALLAASHVTGESPSAIRRRLGLDNPNISQAELRSKLDALSRMAAGAPAMAAPVAGPPVPSGAKAGAHTQITGGQAQTLRREGGMVSSNPPGAEESAKLYQGDRQRAGTFRQDILPMEKSHQLLADLPEGSTGPGSESRQHLQEFLHGLAPETMKQWGIVNPDKIKNWGELHKYMTNATQDAARGIGAHTDFSLATTISGRPGVGINDLSNKEVVKVNIAVRRMEHAQHMAAAQAGPVNYADAKSTWSANIDPRAFAMDLLGPDELKKLKADLAKSPEAMRKFEDSLRIAYESGVITRPGR
jgi:hypothetical protein